MTRLRRWLGDDLAIKAFSVLLAILLWINVAGPERALPTAPVQDTRHNVAVTWRNLPPDLSVAAVEPDTVSVTYRASADVAESLGSQSFTAFVDLRNAVAGRLAFTVDVAVPPGVQLVSVAPSRVTVTLVPLEARAFPVKVELRGSVPSGYEALAPAADPTQVVVRGTRDRVDQVAVVVAAVDVSGRTADVVQAVPLRAVDAEGDPVPDVALQPASARVTVPVVEWTKKDVPVVPVLAGTPAEGYRIESVVVNPATVSLSGSRARVEAADRAMTAPLDISGASAPVTATVAVRAPDGTTPDPQEVQVTVNIAKGP
ncbi:MAG: hypothetical protein IMW98_05125 [Firmicutes bacterium]|nr:hypothetical protein [Bacillota bacterium]